MKNFLLVFNIVLLVLVAYLYYLHFQHDKNPEALVKTTSVANSNEKSKVAYIDLDSLQNNYSYYKKIKADFEKKQSAANDEITAMQKKY
ncbi:MAG TPA: OmpH family outer membrane protein, partial [Hanamia sp.]|nr:OmpH family outer membrane protein [Hanamia sp.]